MWITSVVFLPEIFEDNPYGAVLPNSQGTAMVRSVLHAVFTSDYLSKWAMVQEALGRAVFLAFDQFQFLNNHLADHHLIVLGGYVGMTFSDSMPEG